ncbi:unnamed protein product, partial [Mesorhabditis belari]|uniref:Uncharacterized protein n=1 Tax=Mesorhabditis belari TaxID=2138241 RepID=A0AAF3FQ11_9BILA
MCVSPTLIRIPITQAMSDYIDFRCLNYDDKRNFETISPREYNPKELKLLNNEINNEIPVEIRDKLVELKISRFDPKCWLSKNNALKLPDVLKLEIIGQDLFKNRLIISVENKDTKALELKLVKMSPSSVGVFFDLKYHIKDNPLITRFGPGKRTKLGFNFRQAIKSLEYYSKNPNLKLFPLFGFRVDSLNLNLWLRFDFDGARRLYVPQFTLERSILGGLDVNEEHDSYEDVQLGHFNIKDMKWDGTRFVFKLETMMTLSYRMVEYEDGGRLKPAKKGVRFYDLDNTNHNPLKATNELRAGQTKPFLWSFAELRATAYLESSIEQNDPTKWPELGMEGEGWQLFIKLTWNQESPSGKWAPELEFKEAGKTVRE